MKEPETRGAAEPLPDADAAAKSNAAAQQAPPPTGAAEDAGDPDAQRSQIPRRIDR